MNVITDKRSREARTAPRRAGRRYLTVGIALSSLILHAIHIDPVRTGKSQFAERARARFPPRKRKPLV